MVTLGGIGVIVWTNDKMNYSYSVTHPNKNIDKVYVCDKSVDNWNKSFDNNLHKALHIDNMLYNNNNLIEIPRQFI